MKRDVLLGGLLTTSSGLALGLFFQLVVVAKDFDSLFSPRLYFLLLFCPLFYGTIWFVYGLTLARAIGEAEGKALRVTSYSFLPTLLLLEYPFAFVFFKKYRSLDFPLALALLCGAWGLCSIVLTLYTSSLVRQKGLIRPKRWLLKRAGLGLCALTLLTISGLRVHDRMILAHLEEENLYFNLANETKASLVSPLFMKRERRWTIPDDSQLEVGFGVLNEDWPRRKGGVDFKVFLRLEEDGEEQLLLSKHIDQQAYWFNERVDLKDYGGKKGTFIFKTEGKQPLKDKVLQSLHSLFTYPHPLFNVPRLYQPHKEADELNLIIIAIDTLRADKLGCYGYWGKVSPNIDAIAQEGTLFKRAVSQAPWTLPSFASIFTSSLPSTHQAGFMIQSGFLWTKLDTQNLTLAEVLKKHGFFNAAIVNNPYMESEYGLYQGFHRYYQYHVYSMAQSTNKANLGTKLALEWLENNKNQRFFLFIHYLDPHVPYFDHPDEGLNLFGPEEYRKRILLLPNFDEERLIKYHRLYDGEIAYADKYIGLLIDRLKGWGLYDKSLVVVLSDHGEEFGEHEGFNHGHSLYEELLHIPLIFRLPGVIPEGKAVNTMVRAIDIAPTILDFLKLPGEEAFQGKTLLPWILNGKGPVIDEAFSEALMRGREKKAITHSDYKYIFTPKGGKEELYDLKKDPLEKYNLQKAKPDQAHFYKQRVEQIVSQAKKGFSLSLTTKEVRVSQETREMLRSLGYFN